MPGPTPPRTTRSARKATRWSLSALTTAGLVATLLPGDPLASHARAERPDRPTAAAPAAETEAAGNDVIANLWSWNWPSVANECTDVLAPEGYAAVWVAPPAESLFHPEHAWWDLYQPYSYTLSARLGDESAFADMVRTCQDAGVRVYTDVVINHTAAQTGTGYAGTPLTHKYAHAEYERSHYHVDVCDREIGDYDDVWEVQHCELLGLPDLRTESPDVQARIAGYLNAQIEWGVSGFRVDTAKHMPSADLEAIVGQLNPTADGSAPFVFHEVFPGTVPSPEEYFGSGRVLDFGFGDQVKAAFQGDISQLRTINDGLLPADRAVAFVTNHDTERDGRHLTYRDGDTAVLANVFALGHSQAPPTVYAGFAFDDKDASPPADGAGFVTDTDCASDWYCLNRDPRITGMVGWRNAVGGSEVSRWQSPQGNVIGFARGEGFLAINNSEEAVTADFTTPLADGSYGNVLDGCATEATVSGGLTSLTIPPKAAVALHGGA